MAINIPSTILTRPKTKSRIRALVKRKTAKQQIKKLEKELDALWGKAVHRRWGEKCAWPGCSHVGGILHAHHWMHKSAGKKARWKIENSILLCFFHHIRSVHQMGNTEPIRDVLIERLGLGGFERLRDECAGVWKPTLDQLLELKVQLARHGEE